MCPGEGTGGPADPTEDPGWATGRHASWVRLRSPWGPCKRLGMGWRAVRGVLVSGRGGLLCPRLMTGMCGGRAEDEEDRGRDAVEVVSGTGHRVVLAGAGRRGGGEERVGDSSAETVWAALDVRPLCFSSSSPSSMEVGTGVASFPMC